MQKLRLSDKSVICDILLEKACTVQRNGESQSHVKIALAALFCVDFDVKVAVAFDWLGGDDFYRVAVREAAFIGNAPFYDGFYGVFADGCGGNRNQLHADDGIEGFV